MSNSLEASVKAHNKALKEMADAIGSYDAHLQGLLSRGMEIMASFEQDPEKSKGYCWDRYGTCETDEKCDCQKEYLTCEECGEELSRSRQTEGIAMCGDCEFLFHL